MEIIVGQPAAFSITCQVLILRQGLVCPDALGTCCQAWSEVVRMDLRAKGQAGKGEGDPAPGREGRREGTVKESSLQDS